VQDETCFRPQLYGHLVLLVVVISCVGVSNVILFYFIFSLCDVRIPEKTLSLKELSPIVTTHFEIEIALFLLQHH
jgi:hypothetical protein